jgi:hypothetical protein
LNDNHQKVANHIILSSDFDRDVKDTIEFYLNEVLRGTKRGFEEQV